MKKLFIVLIVIVFCVPICLAETYFVSVDGNNDSPGSIEHPWATIQYALTMAQAGDIIYIRGGIYRQMFDINNSGKEDQWIVFKNYRDEEVNIWWSVDMSTESDWTGHGNNIWYSEDDSFKQTVNYDVATIWHDDKSHWSL